MLAIISWLDPILYDDNQDWVETKIWFIEV